MDEQNMRTWKYEDLKINQLIYKAYFDYRKLRFGLLNTAELNRC